MHSSGHAFKVSTIANRCAVTAAASICTTYRLIRPSFLQDHFFGSGGILGLPSSLTGVLLPEAGPATAVGNALQTGPVTFHIPQVLVDDLRREADAGNQELQQLELDLFRWGWRGQDESFALSG